LPSLGLYFPPSHATTLAMLTPTKEASCFWDTPSFLRSPRRLRTRFEDRAGSLFMKVNSPIL
jgi:hypothetical protein